MCGITGSVGKPKNKILAYNLHTNLLRETKRRGKHATGFYSIGIDRKPIFDKAPISADSYIKRPEWKQLINGNIAMIGHARFTTNGAAHINSNNHPHVSKSGNMALVHNGIIYNYNELKDQYSNVLESECDSEIILRIIAREKDPFRGIKKVYELLGSGGDFACELIHTNPNTGKTTFYFFRDDGRPGVMIDARDTLGQLIFCSEESIWKDAAYKSGMPRDVRQLAVHEVPEYKIIVVDADSLEVKETEVEKPKFKNRYKTNSRNFSHYTDYSDYNDYNYFGNRYNYKYNSNNYNNTKYNNNNYNTKNRINQYSESFFKKSVLGDEWTETINPSNGLPKFVYNPNYYEEYIEEDNLEDDNIIIPEEDQDQEFKELLIKCIDGEQYRYPGWQDEAYSYGLITEDDWARISDEELESSEDILDHIKDGIYIDDTDEENKYDQMSHQDNDEKFFNQIINQQTVDGNEYSDPFGSIYM